MTTLITVASLKTPLSYTTSCLPSCPILSSLGLKCSLWRFLGIPFGAFRFQAAACSFSSFPRLFTRRDVTGSARERQQRRRFRSTDRAANINLFGSCDRHVFHRYVRACLGEDRLEAAPVLLLRAIHQTKESSCHSFVFLVPIVVFIFFRKYRWFEQDRWGTIISRAATVFSW